VFTFTQESKTKQSFLLLSITKAMTKNMGSIDQGIRLVVAVVLVVLYFSDTVTGILGIVALVVAGVFTLTSMLGFCPLYTLLGIKTCQTT